MDAYTTNRGAIVNIPALLRDCFHFFTFRSYWEKLHPQVRNFIRYAAFLTLFSLIVFFRKPTEVDFYLTDRVRFFMGDAAGGDGIAEHSRGRSLFRFGDIRDLGDIWNWLETTVVPSVYEQSVPNAFPGDMMGYNVVLGGIRMRQQRIKKITCPSPPGATVRIATACYPPFDADALQKAPFGAVSQYRFYNSADQAYRYSYWGQVGWYPSEGYVIDFGSNHSEALLMLQQLQNDNWLDVSTRALIFEISVYNPSLQTFTLGNLLVEVPAGGGVITSSRWSTERMFQDMLPAYRYILLLEIAFGIWVLVMLYEECCEMRADGMRAYWSSPWNWLDWVNLLIFVGVIAQRLQMILYLSRQQWNVDSYIDVQALGRVSQNEWNLMAINGFCTYIKAFVFLNQIPSLSIMSRSISTRAGELLQFCVLFILVFFGFVMAFNLAFSGTVFKFRTITQTFYSLFQALLGNFDFYGMYTVDRLVTSVLFTSFVVVCWYTLLSTFVAVLNDAYAFTKEAMRLEQEALYPNKAAARGEREGSEQADLVGADEDEDDQTDFDERPLRQRAMEAIRSFLYYGFDPAKARREIESAEYERELATYQDVLATQQAQERVETMLERASKSAPRIDKPWTAYLDESVEWGHYPRLHRATDQVTELERRMVEMNKSATELTEAVTNIKVALQRMDERVSSLPDNFVAILERTSGDTRLKTVSRRLDLLVKTVVFETHVDPRVLRKVAPPPTLPSVRKAAELKPSAQDAAQRQEKENRVNFR